jgi:hypothetical protein
LTLSTPSTFYFDPLVRWVGRVGGVVTFCLAVLVVAAPIPAVLRIAITFFAFAFLWACWSRWSQVGVEVQTDGLWVWRPMWRRFIPWDEIEQFRFRQRVASCAAVACLTAGRTLTTGLMQGRRMAWEDGSTTDIVAVLNRALHEHRPPSGNR